MMKVLGVLLFGCALAAAAQAQTLVPGVHSIQPTIMMGQAVVTVATANTSQAITSGMATAANSAAFPTGALNGVLTIEPQGTASTGVYVCWQGGTCSAAVGEYLAPGQSRTVYLTTNMGTQPPTLFSTGTPAVVVEW